MSTYHVLNGQPIDQWKVTELKDELCRRNLPINGLKEDLVKRLFEDLQGDILGGEGTVSGSPPDDDLKKDKTTGSADASVCQAAMEQSVDEDPSLVSTQNGDFVVSVKEASKESAVATADVSQEFVVTTEEASQITFAAAEVSDVPLVDVVTTDKISLSGVVPDKEDDLEPAPSDDTMVREVHAQAGGHSEFIAEKALEEDAGKKMIVDHLLSNVASIDIKLDVTPAKGKLDDDIVEHEVVSSPLDAIVPHADHWDVDAVATALGHNVDALIPKISLGDNDLMNCKDHENSGCTRSACKPTLSGPIDQTSGILPATMSTYPVLNNRPIDQWNVTELKDELCRRNLPIKGLKDDLVRRLFQDLEGDTLGGSPPNDDLKGDKISADASVCQDAMEQNVDESPSQVATQEGDPAVSVTKACKKSADATTDVSWDAVVTTEEVSQATLVAATDSDAPLVDSATVDKISLSDAVATKGDDLESAPSHSAIVKGASPQADCHTDIIAEKAPEEDTIKKVIVDYLPYDVASTNVKLDATSAQGKLEADIVEQEEVSSTPDAIVPHTDHLDVHATATAPGQNAETLIPKIDLGYNAFMNGQDREDSGRTNDACKPSLSQTKDQVSAANPDIGSQIKCVLISHDDISTSVEGDVNADDSGLELEARRDIVKPPCSIPSIGDDVRALDDDKELPKNRTSLQEVEYTTNMSFDKKADSPEGASPEKLNFVRSPGNEPIEGYVMKSKHIIPNIRSDDLGRETEVTSDHEVKEVMLFDTVDSSVQTKDIVAEEKQVTPSEKRKAEDQGGVAVEPIKRQRCVDNVKLPKEQTSKNSSDFPKDVVQPALKRSFGRSDSAAGGDSHRERIVPLPQKPATTSLRIDQFVRPFTLKAVQELLGRTGSICSFWMDHIKTHCYVTYSSVDEAVATRNAVYNLQWPPNNGSYLVAEFVDPHEVTLKLEHPPPPPVLISLGTDTAPMAAGFQQPKANQTMLPHGAGTTRGLLPDPQPLTKLFPTSNPVPVREMLLPPPKKPETPALTLDDLFKRTHASPMIYYLPLSEEEVAAKLAARSRRTRRG